LAAGTDWVFRDESAHMNFAFEVIFVERTGFGIDGTFSCDEEL
jgi:hypothetical protein